jgi:hypothetical protein
MGINWSTFWISLAANASLLTLVLSLAWKTVSDRMLARLAAQNQQTLSAYQHELDKMIMVTKVHFETEFAALKTVFEKLAQVRLLMAGLRPSIDFKDPDETKEERLGALAQRLHQFKTVYNELTAITENLSPFYPKGIYEAIDECRRAAYMELSDLMTAGDETFKQGWYQNGRQNVEKFLVAYRKVSELIREHISRLAVAR